MRRSPDVIVVQGAVGGLVAGLVVALWFLILDSAAGRPFHTPAVLAVELFRRDTLEVTAGLVSAYSVLHFGMFAFLGIATLWVLDIADRPPGLLLGFLCGLLVLDVVFYAALFFTGVRISAVIPGVQVLAANVLGGMSMMAYLHRALRDDRPFGVGVLRDYPLLVRGLMTGLLGAVAVAVWFFLLDLAAGQPLKTPAALGSVLLLGAEGPAEIRVTLGLVAAYTMFHAVVFALAGVALVAVAEGLERAPAFLLVGLLAVIVLEGLALGLAIVGAEWVLGMVGWWQVPVANLLAVAAMGWQVWRTHPTLRRRILVEPLRAEP